MIGKLSGNKIPILTGKNTDDESKTGERFNKNNKETVNILLSELVKVDNENKNKKSYIKFIVLVLLALGGGSLYYLMKKPSGKKKKKKKKKRT